MTLTSATAYLYRNDVKIGALKNMQMAVDIETLPTTKQGATDKNVRKSTRSTSIKASLYYDPLDETVTNILTAVYSDTPSIDTLTIVFSEELDLYVKADAIITNLSIAFDFGAAQVADVSLQIKGKPTTVRMVPIDPPEYVYS